MNLSLTPVIIVSAGALLAACSPGEPVGYTEGFRARAWEICAAHSDGVTNLLEIRGGSPVEDAEAYAREYNRAVKEINSLHAQLEPTAFCAQMAERLGTDAALAFGIATKG